ncbi:MAG: DNA ligase D [Candidatus Nitrosopolaris sp.]
MSLEEYRNKRDFSRTPEPKQNSSKTKQKKHKGPQVNNYYSQRFVVQKHHARRLHYDFRLETNDGLLKSWAIPKDISLNPKVKRLAVMTEDHPLDYLTFQGTIPEGNYGAGTVSIWDNGTYKTEHDLEQQLKNGKISFTLFGQILNGRFSLIRTSMREEANNNNQWLLIKANDEFASAGEEVKHAAVKPKPVLTGMYTPGPREDSKRSKKEYLGFEKQFPSIVKPMLGTLVDETFDNKNWAFEIKWDGVRAIFFFNNKGQIFEIKSRNDKHITRRYPELLSPLKAAIKCKESIIADGEIVVLDKRGYPNFQSHQKRMNVESIRDINNLSRQIPATYYLFDILYLDGENLQILPFVDRRKILSDIIVTNDRIRISDFIEEKGVKLFEKIKSMGLEGMMAKRKSSKYMQRTRSADWLKIKNIKTQDCVVIGFTRGEGNREGYFGSLLLAMYDEKGELVFVGHTGSGFNFDLLDKICKRLEKMIIVSSPIKYVPYTNREPTWVKPELVAEVKFHSWTNDRIMRAPIFLRLRDDKSPNECRIEIQEPLTEVVQEADITGHYTSHTQESTMGIKNNKRSSSSAFSNLDKIFWNTTKDHRALTKGDLIDYYEKISEYILPYLKDRPLSLSRYPDGALGKHFYHKNWDKGKPEYVETIKVYSDSSGAVINYIVCNNKDTILWLANLGCIEMHPWYSRIKDFDSCKGQELSEDKCGLNFPDFIVFDLDPYIYSGLETAGEEPEYNINGFKAVVEVAYYLEDLFKKLNISSYVKTSGKTGLHIFVPLISSYTYDQTRRFAEVIGSRLVKTYPHKVTMEWKTIKRKGKVFFDHNQNSKGKTLASIYSVRPTASATVSMPIKWKKLSSVVPTDFNLLNVPAAIKKGDPWKTVIDEKQDINKILENIEIT